MNTKFNIGDKVYYFDSKIEKKIINMIIITAEGIKYCLKGSILDHKLENELFSSKKELKEYLLKYFKN
jgi:hypothetical protein